MADIFNSLKKTWLKGMEVVSNTASNIAVNTKQKVNEMNLENRRREILADFGIIAYEIWQKGEVFPAPLAQQLEELSRLDEELNALKAQRFSGVEETEGPETGPDVSDEASEAPCLDLPEEEASAASEEAPAAPPMMEIPSEAQAPHSASSAEDQPDQPPEAPLS